VEKKLKKIDHFAIKVKSIPSAVDFYSSMGGEVISQYEDWALLGFENVKLALMASDNHPVHVAFQVESMESLKDCEESLLPHRDGTFSIYIEDGEGNFIEKIFYPNSLT
jgi:catechol 2,3-dioxygenase-like lactoylglutathione lyase family enzyme